MQFFLLISVFNNLCLYYLLNHQHVKGCNPDNTNYFPNYFVWVLSVFIIFFLYNVINKYYYEKGSDQWSAQHKVVLLNNAWENIVSSYESSTALNRKVLGFFFSFSLFLLNISCLPDVSNKSYHGTGSNQLSEQHKKELLIVS